MQIIGRRSSLFTRIALIFAEELDVAYEFEPIYDMTVVDPSVYADNPALKLPTLRTGSSLLFGTANICRAIAERSSSHKRVVWPEDLRDDLSRNAQELVWHCAATQVQLVMGTVVNNLPADNPYFAKARQGFEGSMRWLEKNLNATLQRLPPRDLSLFEVSLHCLIEHLIFRPTLPIDPYSSQLDFTREFGKRPSAQRTPYRFDTKPAS
jgi:glutathione S-transferase